MAEPSVKGLLLVSSVDAINQAIATGRIEREEVELALDPRDLELLDAKLEPMSWYPVASLGRMTELVARMTGGDRVATLRQIGERAAESVREQGIYSQMSFDEGAVRNATTRELKSFARQTATIHNMFFNFGAPRVEVEESSDTLLIHYEDMTGYPEATRLTSEGFTAAMATRALGVRCRIECENVREDGFTFRFVIGG